MSRDQVLKQLEQTRADFLKSIEGVPDDVAVSRPVIDWWTLKDLLGHIALWEEAALQFIADYREDGRPKRLGIDDDAALDAINKRGAALRRDWSLERVRGEFDAAFRDLVAAVQALSDEQLNTPFPPPWPADHTLERLISDNSYGHMAEHIEQIRRWRAGQG